MGFEYLRIGTTNRNHNHVHLSKRACGADFYQYPSAGTTLDSLQPVNVTWDTTCLDTTNVDIYLYAPTTEEPKIHLWSDVPYSAGSYEVNLLPRWWNSTSSQQLQLTIIEAGNPPFLASLPAGPIFTATYEEPSTGAPEVADTTIIDSGVTKAGAVEEQSSMSGGKIAAAVIVPLLIVALAIAAYIRFARKKRAEKSNRYSTAIDSRMSTINPDWKSISAAGASAAIRNSMAPGNRASGFSFGTPRPTSSFYAVEDGGQAGIGAARNMYQQENGPVSVSHLRQSVYTADAASRGSRVSFAPEAVPRPPKDGSIGYGERVSTISFAPDTRPSTDRLSTAGRPSTETRMSAYSRPSRAFHSSFVVPDLPARQDSDVDSSGGMSPTQREGPISLTPDVIHARLSTSDRGSGMTNDDVMPALNMMRAQDDTVQYADYAYDEASVAPAHPATAHGTDTLFDAPMSPAGTQSPEPSHSMFSGFAPAPAAMSPDALLLAYSKRNQQARVSGVMSPPNVPGSPIQVPSRVMSPSTPGVYSPSRGAYGIADDPSPYSGAI